MTPRERLRAGSAAKDFRARPLMTFQEPKLIEAQPKPWDEKQPSPYPGGGDNDGDGDTTNKYPPGEEIKIPPSPSPNTDSLSLRKSLDAAVAASADPDQQRAMRAIEARLAEITQYMRAASRGASKDMTIKLGVLSAII